MAYCWHNHDTIMVLTLHCRLCWVVNLTILRWVVDMTATLSQWRCIAGYVKLLTWPRHCHGDVASPVMLSCWRNHNTVTVLTSYCRLCWIVDVSMTPSVHHGINVVSPAMLCCWHNHNTIMVLTSHCRLCWVVNLTALCWVVNVTATLSPWCCIAGCVELLTYPRYHHGIDVASPAMLSC